MLNATITARICAAKTVAEVRRVFHDAGIVSRKRSVKLWRCPRCRCDCLTVRIRICQRCRDEEIALEAAVSLGGRPSLRQVAQYLKCRESGRLRRALRVAFDQLSIREDLAS